MGNELSNILPKTTTTPLFILLYCWMTEMLATILIHMAVMLDHCLKCCLPVLCLIWFPTQAIVDINIPFLVLLDFGLYCVQALTTCFICLTSVCVCVWERERESVCVCVLVLWAQSTTKDYIRAEREGQVYVQDKDLTHVNWKKKLMLIRNVGCSPSWFVLLLSLVDRTKPVLRDHFHTHVQCKHYPL